MKKENFDTLLESVKQADAMLRGAEMNEERARQILGSDINEDGSLSNTVRYLDWRVGGKEACLDADFTADELEAIAFWMRRPATVGEVQK